jgi:hypothetical protein
MNAHGAVVELLLVAIPVVLLVLIDAFAAVEPPERS